MFSHLTSFFNNSESRTVGLVFAFNSFLFGNWVTRIPDIKSNLSLSEADLGFVLLGMPFGAILIMPISGWIISKITLGKAIMSGLLIFAAIAFLPSTTSSLWMLGVSLFFYGLTNAFLDISMNAGAAVVEKKHSFPIMSTCHGMWSFGAMLGSLVGSLFIGFRVDPFIHLSFISLIIVIFGILVSNKISKIKDSQEGGQVFALPNKALLGLAFIAFCILLSEGAVADWSSIYMKDTLGSNPFLVGIAYSGYSFFMALGRFTGDGLIPRFGNKKILILGATISILGLTTALAFNSPVLAIVGFSLTGLGFSCIVPIVFSASAKTQGMSSSAGIAAVATMGYTGFLIGPPLIGFIAEYYGLQIGLSLVIILALAVGCTSFKIKV
jgi:fucose permease